LYTVNSAIIAGAAGVPVGAARCRMSIVLWVVAFHWAEIYDILTLI